jgi:hypothetical protein
MVPPFQKELGNALDRSDEAARTVLASASHDLANP